MSDQNSIGLWPHGSAGDTGPRPTTSSESIEGAGKAQLCMLHLEDNPKDAELIRVALEDQGFVCDVVLAQTKSQFEEAISERTFDLVLSDYALPNYNGLAALGFLRAKQPNTPFILVSGTLGEEEAIESLKSGATDYLLKTRLTRLAPAIRRALTQAKAEAQHRTAREELRQSQELFRRITECVEDLITVLDLEGKRIFNSPSYRHLLGDPELLVGSDSFEGVHPDDVERMRRIFHETVASGVGQRAEYRLRLKDGTIRFIESQGSVIRNEDGQISNVLVVSRDITERTQASAELQETHRRLLETSRQAGMAEVATGVLHNVGNVLNSVNVSATLVAETLAKSKAVNLTKVAALLREHAADLGAFLTSDPKGKQLPDYFSQLVEHLAGERATLLKEMEQFRRDIEHIKDIVSMQQSYAKVSGVTESIQAIELVEDALRLNAGALVRHEVQVVREYAADPTLVIDKHKALQVLVNLIRNANYACDESGRKDKQITVRITSNAGRSCIAVIDNGVGIPAENLTRIFHHGFTTRKDGHGFGLHSGALAAQELGGSLLAQSDGVGHGATFTLELPLNFTGRSPPPATAISHVVD